MLRLFTASIIAATALAASACDPYNPDLGSRPYRCASEGPKCPDGYEAVEVPQPVVCECRLPDAPAEQADAGSCANDPTEPNDFFANARQTPVGAGSMTAEFHDQAICSPTDVDTYSFQTTATNQKVTATLQFQAAIGQLTLAIVDQNGLPIGMGPMSQGMALVATATIPNPGKYYVQVKSTNGTNTYALLLSLQ
jgi:hypothetical protein